MFDVYRFPVDFVPFWHLGARMFVGPFVRFLHSISAQRKGDISLLDIGSGGGWHTLLAAAKGLHVSCLDISAASIENTLVFARRMGIEANIHAQQGDCYSLSFPDNSFDAVVSSHVIEHLEKPEKMLQEIKRVLKPGGRVLLCCPSLHQGMRLSRWLGIHLDPADHKVVGYTREEIAALLPEGFRLKNVIYQGRFFESNVTDIQGLLARLTGIKANPVATPPAERDGKKMNGIQATLVFGIREVLFSVLMMICTIEDLLFFYMKGSALGAEIDLEKPR
jgi:SAM-dependent methyltransferase